MEKDTKKIKSVAAIEELAAWANYWKIFASENCDYLVAIIIASTRRRKRKLPIHVVGEAMLLLEMLLGSRREAADLVGIGKHSFRMWTKAALAICGDGALFEAVKKVIKE